MEIYGIPGSLTELLKPVENGARLRGIYPVDFDALWNMGSIGRVVQRIEESYKIMGIKFNHITARGAIGEYRFLDEARTFFSGSDLHIFNNCRFNCETDEVSGLGLESYPDHLILSRNGFVYVETKNWTKKYAEKHKTEIKEQIDLTLRNMDFYFRNMGISSVPMPILYDAAGSIDINGVRVVRKVSDLSEFLNGKIVAEHDRIFEVLLEAAKSA